MGDLRLDDVLSHDKIQVAMLQAVAAIYGGISVRDIVFPVCITSNKTTV